MRSSSLGDRSSTWVISTSAYKTTTGPTKVVITYINKGKGEYRIPYDLLWWGKTRKQFELRIEYGMFYQFVQDINRGYTFSVPVQYVSQEREVPIRYYHCEVSFLSGMWLHCYALFL